jgi:protein-S-isoprenylcysteine O-methyltransferase Ste14
MPTSAGVRDETGHSRWALAAIGPVLTFAWLALSAAAWGGVTGLLADPARRVAVLAALALSLVAAVSPFNLSPGRRADIGDLWIVPVALGLVVLFAWLPPWFDRRERWVIDGEGLRWFGCALFIAGGALRVWPIFVLGRRFSGIVAIQEGHQLVTDGPYRRIRNPSYLGGRVNATGWTLVFRSAVGLLLLLPFAWLTVARIRAEEALLASEFGGTYEAYRRRTWRLVPWVY